MDSVVPQPPQGQAANEVLQSWPFSGRLSAGQKWGRVGVFLQPPLLKRCPFSPPQAALQHGVIAGRRGFGSIFVVASGNGGHHNDNCNYDGYANSIYTVTIGNGSASAGLSVLSPSPGQVPSQDGRPFLAVGEAQVP